jgi:hypothetical protein
MGADFILYCCEDPTDYKKAIPMIEYRIANMSDDNLDCIAEDVLWHDSEEVSEEVGGDHALKESDLWKLNDLIAIRIRGMVRDKIREAVDEIFDGCRRDVAHMHINGTRYLMTGGMSWGDLPTEACDLVNLIENSQVTDGMGDPNFDYESFKA